MMRLLVSLGLGLAAFASTSLAATTTVTFDGGVNTGSWTYGFGMSTPSTGGNPGWYLRSQGLDTFAPQLRTQGDSVFTGNYRDRGVSAIGVDLNTFAVDFSAAGRPLALMLIEDNGTPGNPDDDWAAYTLHPDNIPVPGEGWRSFSFDVPSDSTTLPAGWNVISLGFEAPTPDWNTVITDVDQVVFFYGDPKFFFIFQMWTLGADNIAITETPPPSCAGDANHDGRTDSADLSVLLAQFGTSVEAGTGADFNGDGAVNAADLSVLLGQFNCGTGG